MMPPCLPKPPKGIGEGRRALKYMGFSNFPTLSHFSPLRAIMGILKVPSRDFCRKNKDFLRDFGRQRKGLKSDRKYLSATFKGE
jgi:hypothetical protein